MKPHLSLRPAFVVVLSCLAAYLLTNWSPL